MLLEAAGAEPLSPVRLHSVPVALSGEVDRIDYVDGLRAIAVLAVIIFHALLHGHAPESLVRHIGAHGVTLFFVISGFCLAYPTLAKVRRSGSASFDVIGYAARRLWRILPPYYVCLAIFSVVLMYFGATHQRPPEGMAPHATLSDFLTSLIFADRSGVQINGSFWSLAVEFRWYLYFPILLAISIARPRALITIAILGSVLAISSQAASIDLGVMPAFALGIVAAQLNGTRTWLTRAAPIFFLITACIAVRFDSLDRLGTFSSPAWIAACFLLVISAGSWAPLRRGLSLAPIAAIGVASYSIYLVHEPIVSLISWNLEPRVNEPVAVLLGVVASLTAGFVIWVLVERPTQRKELRTAVITKLRAPLERYARALGIATAFDLHDADHASGPRANGAAAHIVK